MPVRSRDEGVPQGRLDGQFTLGFGWFRGNSIPNDREPAYMGATVDAIS
jgi:hypothetical protein